MRSCTSRRGPRGGMWGRCSGRASRASSLSPKQQRPTFPTGRGRTDAVAVTRSQRGVSFTDSLGTRRKFTVKQGWLAMTVDDGSEQEVTQMVYNSVHGQVAVDGEVSFLLQVR
eukprot:1004022-Rhodomonas_salina.3